MNSMTIVVQNRVISKSCLSNTQWPLRSLAFRLSMRRNHAIICSPNGSIFYQQHVQNSKFLAIHQKLSQNIQMNIRIPDVTLALPRVSWIHLNFLSWRPQESVYHYFGGPNKLFAAWFQLMSLAAVNEFPNCLVVIVCTWKTQTWKSHWLLKLWVPRSVGEIKGYWDLYCEWVSKLPFYQKTWGNVGENSARQFLSPVFPSQITQGHGSLGRASQTSSWRCWYCQPEPLSCCVAMRFPHDTRTEYVRYYLPDR